MTPSSNAPLASENNTANFITGKPHPRFWPEGCGHLPEETLASQAQGIDSLAAVGSLVGAGEQWDGDEIGQVFGQLLQGVLAELACRAASAGGEAGAEGGEEGGGRIYAQ